MANTFAQEWTLYRYADGEIVLTGTDDASGWTLQAEVAAAPGNDPDTAITPTVSTTVITIPFSASLMTTTLTDEVYYVGLWRTDGGSKKPLAAGRLTITTVASPA